MLLSAALTEAVLDAVRAASLRRDRRPEGDHVI